MESKWKVSTDPRRPGRVKLADGLYMVETDDISASFEVHNGYVTRCAPILWRRLDYWIRKAELIKPL